MQQDANREVVKQVSTGSVMATQGYVLNQTRENLSLEGQQAVQQAFGSAQEDVPELMLEASENTENQTKVLDISDRVSGSIQNLLSEDRILIVVPLIAFGMYGLQPLVGILTAIFAKLTQTLSRPEESETPVSHS